MTTTRTETARADARTEPLVAGFAHVNLTVTDLDAAIGFYGGVFGFEVLARPDFGGRANGAWLRCGALQLHLSVSETMPDPNGNLPHTAFYIPAERFDAAMAELERRGIPFMFEPRSREDFGVTVRAAFVQDPSGNYVELTDVAPFAD